VSPNAEGGGIGLALKLAQRAWALQAGAARMSWTFDPLLRRNAWFNIEVLGVHVSEYVPNFYGPMTDSINAHDESDRIVAAWPTDPAAPRPTAPAGATTLHVDTPADIVVLRHTDPAEAMEWRRRVRKELGELIDAGATVTGFTREGQYVLQVVP